MEPSSCLFTGSSAQPVLPFRGTFRAGQALPGLPNSAINVTFSHQPHPSVSLVAVRTTSAKLAKTGNNPGKSRHSVPPSRTLDQL